MDRCLKKEQRVYRESDIQSLFSRGRRETVFPVKGVIRPRGDGGGPRLMVSVPKRLFRHAVDRVRIKRMLREAFRSRKPDIDADIALLFAGSEMPEFAQVDRCVEAVLRYMEKKYRTS